MERKLDGNCTRILRAVLNKSWRQHPTKKQLYGHQSPISKIMHTRRAGHCWRRKGELIINLLSRPLHTDEHELGDQLEPIYNSSVLIEDAVWKTCRERWTIGTSGGRGSRKSVPSSTLRWWWWCMYWLLICSSSISWVNFYYSSAFIRNQFIGTCLYLKSKT